MERKLILVTKKVAVLNGESFRISCSSDNFVLHPDGR